MEIEQEVKPDSSAKEEDCHLPGIVPANIIKTEEDIEDDFIFTIMSFLHELERMRDLLKQMWSGFKDGSRELMMCSLLTNLAIQLVRRSESELDLLTERPQKYPASSYPVRTFPGIYLYETHEKKTGNADSNSARLLQMLEPTACLPLYSCEHSEFCLWNVFNALKHTLLDVKGAHKNIMLPEYEHCPPTDDEWPLPETFCRIKRMMQCLQAVSRTRGKHFATDEIIHGINFLFETKTVPIWVAFGVQLLLDVQDELQTVPEMTLQDIQSHASSKTLDFSNLKLANESSMHEKVLRWISDVARDYQEDILEEKIYQDYLRNLGDLRLKDGPLIPAAVLRKEPRNSPKVPPFLWERDHILRLNPVKCGTLKYGMYLKPHKFACDYVALLSGLSLTAMVHLYVAGRSLFPNDPVWPDMVSICSSSFIYLSQ